jgi:hypothetical protein
VSSARRQENNHEVPPEVEVAIDRSRGGGQSLDTGTKTAMEATLGADFGRVRVHTDAKSHALNQRLNAVAFTTGNDIFFREGKYMPANSSGRELLAHELTHVVQQGGGSSSGKLELGKADDPYEQEADAVAKRVGKLEPGAPSGAEAGTQPASAFHPVVQPNGGIRMQRGSLAVQRTVSTLGGDWDATPSYQLVNDGTQDTGVEIDRLHFTPKDPVNATKIGLTQRVVSIQNGSPLALNPSVAGRSIPSGQDEAGSHIDRLEGRTNPIYGMNDPTDAAKTLGGSVSAGNSQWGWHYKDAGGTAQHQDATLYDKPQLSGHGANSSQIFETVALAVEGTQAGTSYGSVRWGWRSDAANRVTKEPVSVVSAGVPSAAFRRSADLWNASTTPGGAHVVQLPAMHALLPPAGTEAAEVEKALKVNDYATAYQILNAQWIRPMLTTLSQLNTKGLLPGLYSNTDKAVGVDPARLRVAIEAVQYKENHVPLSQEFNDWINPAKNNRTDQIQEIKSFIGMK